MAANGSRCEFSIIRSMKRPGLTPHLLSATLFLVPAVAPSLCAQETMATTPAAKAAKRADELLKRFDKNGDGKLDDDERADAKEVMMKEQIDRQMLRFAALPGGLEQFRPQVLEMFDKNRDGRLDDGERAAAQKFAESRQGPIEDIDDLTKRFDKNGDGRIDEEERAQVSAYLSELRALGAVQIRNDLLQRFDRNADGKVDESEMVELERFVRPRIEANPAQLRRHDKNNDGKLDETEWAAARIAIMQWLNAAGPAALENEPMRGEDLAIPNEQARLKAIAAEVERRRSQRTETPKSGDTSK